MIDDGQNNWRTVWVSRHHNGGDMSEPFDVEISGAQNLRIVVDHLGYYDCDFSVIVNPDLYF
jgi:hypothetical protein